MSETYKTIYSRGWSAGYKAAEEVAVEKLQEVIDYLKGPSPTPECIIGEPKKPTEPVFTFSCPHCTSWDETNERCKYKTCWRIAEYGQQPVEPGFMECVECVTCKGIKGSCRFFDECWPTEADAVDVVASDVTATQQPVVAASQSHTYQNYPQKLKEQEVTKSARAHRVPTNRKTLFMLQAATTII